MIACLIAAQSTEDRQRPWIEEPHPNPPPQERGREQTVLALKLDAYLSRNRPEAILVRCATGQL
jgi:hypothetical protein